MKLYQDLSMLAVGKNVKFLTLPVPGGVDSAPPPPEIFPPKAEKLFYSPETCWESNLRLYASFGIKTGLIESAVLKQLPIVFFVRANLK